MFFNVYYLQINVFNIYASVVLSQYTRFTGDYRQTDDRQHIMTIAGHCNEIPAVNDVTMIWTTEWTVDNLYN